MTRNIVNPEQELKSVRGSAPDTPASCAQLDQPTIDNLEGTEMLETCERCGQLVKSGVLHGRWVGPCEDDVVDCEPDDAPPAGFLVESVYEPRDADRFARLDEAARARVAAEMSEPLPGRRTPSHRATVWSVLCDFASLVIGEAGSKRERYEARQAYNAFPDAVKSAFWKCYREMQEHAPVGVDTGRPDGQHGRDYDVPAMYETIRRVGDEFELVAARLDDSETSLRWDGEALRRFEEPAGVMSSTFARALDAEWSARRPLVSCRAGRSVAREETPEEIEDREAGVVEEFVATELNRKVALDERYEREARRREEALVVVDRRAVTICPPAIARELKPSWDFERGEWKLVAVRAENKRHWHEQPETASAFAASVVSKLKARGVPVRTWRPDNTPEQARKVRAFRYWKQHPSSTPAVAAREVYSFTRFSPGRLAEVLEELDNVNEEVNA